MPSPLQPWSFSARAVNGTAECPSCSSPISLSCNYYRHLKNCQLFQKFKAETLSQQASSSSPSIPRQLASQPPFSLAPLSLLSRSSLPVISQGPRTDCSTQRANSPRTCQAPSTLADVRRARWPHFPPANCPPPAHGKTLLPSWFSDPDRASAQARKCIAWTFGRACLRPIPRTASKPSGWPHPHHRWREQFKVHYTKDTPDPVEVRAFSPPFSHHQPQGLPSLLFLFSPPRSATEHRRGPRLGQHQPEAIRAPCCRST